MKNKLLPLSITFIFIIIFIVFYKGLKDTNIYTPESKINNEVPSFELSYLSKVRLLIQLKFFNQINFIY